MGHELIERLGPEIIHYKPSKLLRPQPDPWNGMRWEWTHQLQISPPVLALNR